MKEKDNELTKRVELELSELNYQEHWKNQQSAEESSSSTQIKNIN